MSYILFGSKGCGSAVVEIALNICEVKYRCVNVTPWEPGSAVEELSKLNPLKQIPTLQMPEGNIMTESAAIIIELGLRHPDSALLPADPISRSQAIRGLVYIAANCYAAISVIDYPMRWYTSTNDADNERVRAGSKEKLYSNWEIFADQFPATPYLSGEQLGGLDILAAIVTKWSGTRAHLQKSRPDFLATIEKIERHPKVAEVFSRHWDN